MIVSLGWIEEMPHVQAVSAAAVQLWHRRCHHQLDADTDATAAELPQLLKCSNENYRAALKYFFSMSSERCWKRLRCRDWCGHRRCSVFGCIRRQDQAIHGHAQVSLCFWHNSLTRCLKVLSTMSLD